MNQKMLKKLLREMVLKELWENITIDVQISAWNEEKEGGTSTPMVQFSIHDTVGKTLVAPRVYEVKKDFSKFLSDVQKEIAKIIKK